MILENRPQCSFDLLIDCLTREDGIMIGLCAACEAQMKALRDNKAEAIDRAVKDIYRLVAGLVAAEAERREIQATLEQELGLAAGSTLSDLLPHTSGETKETLTLLFKQMRSKADLLREVNHINAIMTKRALTFNRLVLSAVNPEEGLTYRMNGNVGQGSYKELLVNKTV